MKDKYIFGKLNSDRKYLYINDSIISIKCGGLALFGDSFLAKEETIKINEINNIEVARPMFKSGTMIITTSSGERTILEIATMQQYNDALKIKEHLLK